MVGEDVRVVELVGRVVAGRAASSAARATMFSMSWAVTFGRPLTEGMMSSSAPSARISWKRSSVKQSAITISAR